MRNIKQLKDRRALLRSRERQLEHAMSDSFNDLESSSRAAYLKIATAATVGTAAIFALKKLRSELEDKPLAAAAAEMAGEYVKSKLLGG